MVYKMLSRCLGIRSFTLDKRDTVLDILMHNSFIWSLSVSELSIVIPRSLCCETVLIILF